MDLRASVCGWHLSLKIDNTFRKLVLAMDNCSRSCLSSFLGYWEEDSTKLVIA